MNDSNVKQHGFSLLEIFTVAVVGSVLISAGMPFLQNYSDSHKVLSVQKQLAESIASARHQALGKGVVVNVCASVDGLHCSKEGWASGWLVYEEQPNAVSDNALVDPQYVLERVRLEEASVELWMLDDDASAIQEIRFDSQGFNADAQRMTGLACVRGEMNSDALVIERSGRIRFGKNSENKKISEFSCSSV